MKNGYISILLLSFCLLLIGCGDEKEKTILNLKQQVSQLSTLNNNLKNENNELRKQIKYFEKVYNATVPPPSKSKKNSGIYDSVFK